MRKTGISFRTEGGYDIGVYRTFDADEAKIITGPTMVTGRIAHIFFGTDKKWHLSICSRTDKVEPTIEHQEMHDIIGMMNSLARTDNYGHPDIRTFENPLDR